MITIYIYTYMCRLYNVFTLVMLYFFNNQLLSTTNHQWQLHGYLPVTHSLWSQCLYISIHISTEVVTRCVLPQYGKIDKSNINKKISYNNKGLAIQVLIIFLFNFYTFHKKVAILWQQKQLVKMTNTYNTGHTLTITLDLRYQTPLFVPYPLSCTAKDSNITKQSTTKPQHITGHQ